MEWALKTSFRLKANSQVFYNDDVWCFTGISNAAAVTVEDFPVEDLLNLDLPEMEFQDGSSLQEEEDDESQTGGLNFSTSSSSSSFSAADEFDCLSAGEISVPVEDLENLEWLSQFVEDSSPELSLLCPAGSFPEKPFEPVLKFGAPTFPFTFPRKSRTTRTKPSGRQWSLPPPPPPSLSAESSSTTSSSNGSSTFPAPFLFTNVVHDLDQFSNAEKPPPAKQQKRKPDATAAAETGRRCMHCQVQKTPQWRAGPFGPKTLCNACGVRFKSGRLFPEYRPACSPTFSLEVHSNSHRKVLEMRRRKEASEMEETAVLTPSGLSQSA